MSRITDSARGRDCEIRLPMICAPGPDNETVVFCHFRLQGVSGIGYKTESPIGAFGCYACHSVVDRSKDPEVQLAFAHACMRTINILWKEGVIRA
jgi:hypothetical protein